MQLQKEQKQILLGSGVLVLILAIITLTSRSDFVFREDRSLKSGEEKSIDVEAYLRYLENLQVDQQASRELFSAILTDEDIKKEVEKELQISQTVEPPAIKTGSLAQGLPASKQAAVDYMAKLTGSFLNYNTRVKDLEQNLFSPGFLGTFEIQKEHSAFLSEIYRLPAPTDALELRNAILAMQEQYNVLIQQSLAFQSGELIEPWPGLYKSYAVVNEQAKIVDRQIKLLGQKYNVAELSIVPIYAFEKQENQFRLISQARAFLGIGDVTITIGDIPRIIKEAIEEGLTTAFANFMGAMLNKLIAKIESNYLIANFLYYTDALIAGQYTDDYLNKYVASAVDRNIIKKFIPQLNCGNNPQDLRPIFQAKASEYLGFDIKTLRPSDPNFYEKLARIGDPYSFASTWESYYESVALKAQSEAEKAAERELTSPGLKTPRDTTSTVIAISVNNIVSASRASLNALMNLGLTTSENFISGIVSQLTQTLVNKFVFKGATTGGPLGVFKEQKVCLATAQLSPVLALEPTAYVAPPNPPTQEQLLEQECAKYPRGCTVLPNEP